MSEERRMKAEVREVFPNVVIRLQAVTPAEASLLRALDGHKLTVHLKQDGLYPEADLVASAVTVAERRPKKSGVLSAPSRT